MQPSPPFWPASFAFVIIVVVVVIFIAFVVVVVVILTVVVVAVAVAVLVLAFLRRLFRLLGVRQLALPGFRRRHGLASEPASGLRRFGVCAGGHGGGRVVGRWAMGGMIDDR